GDQWLGPPSFRPVMEELHRRRAVVHVHPTAANCCRNLDYAPGVAPGSLEYGTDTTRAIMGIAFSGDGRAIPTSGSSGRMPAGPRRFSPAASTAPRATPRIACPMASCT